MRSLEQPGVAVAPAIDVAQFARIRDQLAAFCGVYLDDTRQPALRAALGQHLATSGQSLADFLARIASPAANGELQGLCERLLNHETVFLRNQPQLRALSETLLPEFQQQAGPQRPLRIWSAGCATGEEAYSLAICALEALGELPPRPIEIIATDLSSAALARAQAAVYRGRTLGYLSAAQRQRFFVANGDTLSPQPAVRQLVRFMQHNLLDPFPAEVQQVDMIFCQNVTIYFKLETCRTLIQRFHQVLNPGGMLFLGFSETLWNVFDGFRTREVGSAFVYYKEPQSTSQGKAPDAEQAVRRASVQSRRPSATRVTSSIDMITQLRQARTLLDAGDAEGTLSLLGKTPPDGQLAAQKLALIARAHANRGDLDLAAAEAQRALELDALTTEAYLLLGLVYLRQNQLPDAVRQFERARYLDSESPLIAYHLAETYRQLQQDDLALREYRNAVRRLTSQPPDALIDGVAVRWLIATCQRYMTVLQSGRYEKGV